MVNKKISNLEFAKYLQDFLQNVQKISPNYHLHFKSNKGSDDIGIPYVQEDETTFGTHEQGCVEIEYRNECAPSYDMSKYRFFYWVMPEGSAHWSNQLIIAIEAECHFGDTNLDFTEEFIPNIQEFKTRMETILTTIDHVLRRFGEDTDCIVRFIKLL